MFSAEELIIFRPDGSRFLTSGELYIEQEKAVARANAEAQRADAEAQRAERLIAQLRAAGIEPEAV